MIIKVYKKNSKMEHGGNVPEYPEIFRDTNNSNTELEDGESILVPDGQLFKVSGKTHSEGGEKMNLPGGSRIFSEFLKAPSNISSLVLNRDTKKKYSYADLSKKFPTEKSLNTLKNPDSDQFKTNTAKITLAKNEAMLETIFSAQEAEKKQNNQRKFQAGGVKLKDGQFDMTTQDWMTYHPLEFTQGVANPHDYNYFYDYPQVHTEPSPTVTTGLVLPNKELGVLSEPPTDLQLVMSNRKSFAPVPLKDTFRPKGGKPKGKMVQQPEQTIEYPKPFPNFDQLPSRPLPTEVQSITPRDPFANTSSTEEVQIEGDNQDFPGVQKSKNKFGINPKLAGTIMDIGLALSDNLDVEAPVLFNNKVYPLFNRYVQFDNKEPGRNLALSIQQVQNSNMPEQVKQAQIAQLTAQANEQQSQTDFANQQRYEQKQERDTNKLQQYLDRNTLVGNQDLENYLQRKGRVESLKNQFKANRKSRIVNSIRGYADYADQLNLENQIYADNYRVNPITGKVDFTGSKQDPLKQQENLMSQYAQNSRNQISLPNGATLTMLTQDTGIVVDSNGKTEIIKMNR